MYVVEHVPEDSVRIAGHDSACRRMRRTGSVPRNLGYDRNSRNRDGVQKNRHLVRVGQSTAHWIQHHSENASLKTNVDKQFPASSISRIHIEGGVKSVLAD